MFLGRPHLSNALSRVLTAERRPELISVGESTDTLEPGPTKAAAFLFGASADGLEAPARILARLPEDFRHLTVSG